MWSSASRWPLVAVEKTIYLDGVVGKSLGARVPAAAASSGSSGQFRE
jgi:hypothetical protein